MTHERIKFNERSLIYRIALIEMIGIKVFKMFFFNFCTFSLKRTEIIIWKQDKPTKLRNEHLQDGIGKHCGKITNYNVICY